MVQSGTASAPVSLHRAGKSLTMSLESWMETASLVGCHFAPAHHAHTPPPHVQGKASGRPGRERELAPLRFAGIMECRKVGLQVRVPDSQHAQRIFIPWTTSSHIQSQRPLIPKQPSHLLRTVWYGPIPGAAHGAQPVVVRTVR